MASSSFTLSSTTDGSSASSALFDRGNGTGGRADDGNNVLSSQLKRLYRAITNLETKVKMEDAEDLDDVARSSRTEPRITLKGKQPESASNSLPEDEAERERWRAMIASHKQYVSF